MRILEQVKALRGSIDDEKFATVKKHCTRNQKELSEQLFEMDQKI